MKRKLHFIVFVSLIIIKTTFAQLPDSCKLNIGTNLAGLSDYGTELPFVDMMHSCRVFYSQDANNPNGGPFNTEATDSMTFRPDGYPTHIPQIVPGRPFTQKISTIWAYTAGWTQGQYVVLFDGAGVLSFWGGFSNLTQSSPNRIVFDLENSSNDMIQMSIESSDSADPIRNIRVLIPGTEYTYSTQPFNPIWLSKALVFKSFRFMDWGSTNNWGQDQPWEWNSPVLYDWNERQQMDHYTWANNKGIPYEMMITFMNEFDVDGWVCVPHRSSNNYIQNMAQLFHAQLEPQRKLTVEYSNEIWNWMFGQAQWCNAYGVASSGLPWPECTVQYIQNCLDIWTAEYSTDLNKISRAVGIQTGWLDVAQRVAFNMVPNSFDAIAATYYFGLGQSADSVLDILGASATTASIAYWARYTRNINEKIWIQDIKTTIADSLDKKLVFYEGGQHLTPTPFGEEPTYAQALLDVQRDTTIYNLYNEWYDFVRTLQTGDTPLQLMNFSFVGGRSARYGSWGILETMDQDTSLIPAPKYQSTIENMAKECISKTWTGMVNNNWSTTGNWTPVGAPGFNDNVLIPSSSVLMPVIHIAEANCNNLMIDKDAILTIDAGMTLTVNGNLIIVYE